MIPFSLQMAIIGSATSPGTVSPSKNTHNRKLPVFFVVVVGLGLSFSGFNVPLVGCFFVPYSEPYFLLANVLQVVKKSSASIRRPSTGRRTIGAPTRTVSG